MDRSMKEQLKGNAKIVKGKIEEATGKVLDDKMMQAHGLADQASGKARKAVGKVVEHIEDKIDGRSKK